MSSFLVHVRASRGCSADLANGVAAGLLPKLWIWQQIVPVHTHRSVSRWGPSSCTMPERLGSAIWSHRLALGLVEHSLGSSGCSKKHQGSPGPLYLIFEMWLRSSCLSKSRLSLSVSFASEASRTEKPQQSGSCRPLTGLGKPGLGKPGFGNQRSIPGPAIWTTPRTLDLAIPGWDTQLGIEVSTENILILCSFDV